MGLKEAIDSVNNAVEQSKKLTTKTRKALPDKVFCGPGRSFPTHDCAHVRAAKAYLGRSKFSKSTKQKIAACINRRAKTLKCNVSKKAKGELAELSLVEVAITDSEIFRTTKELVEQSLENEGMDLEFEGCEE